MGREVRRVPASWEHPKNENGHYIPQFDRSFAKAAEEWDREKAGWDAGERPDYIGNFTGSFEEWTGERPDPERYMPDWPDSERTHYQMYEDTSEGTPISPVMDGPEALARWLVDNNASAFGNQTADYESWLRVCNGGFAPGLVIQGNVVMNGVEALKSDEQ